MFKYITNELITEIGQDFFNFLESNNPYSGDFKNKHKSNIRKNMLMFFNSFKFQNNYKKLALSLGEECGVKSEQLLYQPLPTPRIFRPGSWHRLALRLLVWSRRNFLYSLDSNNRSHSWLNFPNASSN